MITNPINELTVYLDNQEDLNVDVSLPRTLTSYNYLSVPFLYPYNNPYDLGNGYSISFNNYHFIFRYGSGYGYDGYGNGFSFDYYNGHHYGYT